MSAEPLVERVADAMWRTVNEPKLPGGVEAGPQRRIGRYEWSIYQRMARAAIEVIGDQDSFACVVLDCAKRFTDYEALNEHSRAEHVEVMSRYPGVTPAGDFRWFTL